MPKIVWMNSRQHRPWLPSGPDLCRLSRNFKQPVTGSSLMAEPRAPCWRPIVTRTNRHGSGRYGTRSGEAFARPVAPTTIDVGYVPTQMLAEAFGFDDRYQSHLGKGMNVVVFDPSAFAIGELELRTAKRVSYELERHGGEMGEHSLSRAARPLANPVTGREPTFRSSLRADTRQSRRPGSRSK
jgi:hypothetical protein